MTLAWNQWITELNGNVTPPVYALRSWSTAQAKAYTVGSLRRLYVNNPGVAFTMGGQSPRTFFSTNTHQTNMATETSAYSAPSSMTVPRDRLASLGDGQTRCFAVAGATTGTTNVNSIDKVTASTAVTSALTTTTSTSRRAGAGLMATGTKGYFLGGYTNTQVVTGDLMNYVNETCAAAATANLSAARWGGTAVNCADDKGYTLGGQDAGSKTTADKTVYSTDTTSYVSGANLSQARRQGFGANDMTTYAYVCGGISGSTFVVTCDRLTIAADTTAAYTTGNLTAARATGGFCSSFGRAAYFVSGYSNSTTLIASVEKLTFATGVSSAVATAALSKAMGDNATAGTGSL